ncbi:hypothetical protein AGOR_G00196020 [Albula goreensis]|uniref:Ig-like domain-containing protein n=1 Tax=Albula goreensis TaxID=1534307 RepID=A0A8T3CT73_9TELE|nr:hypothetical protein AGOR_G00196020 [Albula goreensis]
MEGRPCFWLVWGLGEKKASLCRRKLTGSPALVLESRGSHLKIGDPVTPTKVLVAGLWTQRGDLSDCGTHPDAQSPVLTAPEMAYLGGRVELQCVAPGLLGPITYQLLKGSADLPLAAQTPEVDHPASFSLMVQSDSSGTYHCRARQEGDPDSCSLSSNSHIFQVVIPVRGARLVPDPDPAVLWEGDRLALHCEVQQGSHLSYQWYLNRTELSIHTHSAQQGATLLIHPVSQQDSGSYYCMVGNAMTNSRVSSSQEVDVHVKVLLSQPRISFSVTKEEAGYRANVMCQSTRGTLPAQFWLLMGDVTLANRTTAALSATFSVAVTLGKSLGTLRCAGGNRGNQLPEVHSRPLELEVVPVGGAVELHAEYLYSADSRAQAIRLQCSVTQGTFPEYAWFLNHTQLEGGGDWYIVTQQGHTLFLPSITVGNSGNYHCAAKDSFDNTSWVLSPSAFIHSTELALNTLELIVVCFFCFILLVIVGFACFLFILSNGQSGRAMQSRTNDFALTAIPSSSEDAEAMNN